MSTVESITGDGRVTIRQEMRFDDSLEGELGMRRRAHADILFRH